MELSYFSLFNGGNEKLTKKVMECRILAALVIGVLLMGVMVSAEDSWDSFTDNSSSSSDTVGVDNSSTDSSSGDSVTGNTSFTNEDTLISPPSTKTAESSGESFKYTTNFYIALGVGGFGILIVILLVLSFILRPHNKWKKVESRKI
jgi:hypothetical protein